MSTFYNKSTQLLRDMILIKTKGGRFAGVSAYASLSSYLPS